MAKYKVVVYTSTNWYSYECNLEEQKDRFIRLEKAKTEVIKIRVGWKTVYKK